MGKKYYSEALKAVHESAKDLYEIGAISEKEMKEFDEGCFVKEQDKKFEAEKIFEAEHATA
jgi:DNA-binding transcriptional regulator YiaG